MNLTDQNLREKEFHNKLQSKSKGRFENIFYKAILNAWDDFYNFLNTNAKNSEILDTFTVLLVCCAAKTTGNLSIAL